MGYEEFVRNQNILNQAGNIWSQIINSPAKYKNSVESKSKIVFYEDLYNQLSEEEKKEIGSPEDFKDGLKMFFKCEHISYNLIKSYNDYVMKKFESGYLWNKITSEKKYDKLFKEVEFIDKDVEHKSVAINYPKMFESVKKTYPKYMKTKRDMRKVLESYFDKQNIECAFISDDEEFANYTDTVVNKLMNK